MKRTILVLLVILLVSPVFAERVAMPAVTMPSAASNAMGGHHVAYTDNVFSLLVNPGALVRTQQRSFFTIAPSLYSPQLTSDLANTISEMFGSMGDDDDSSGMIELIGNMMDTLKERDGKFALGFELRELPLLSFASVRNGFGFAFWQNLSISANFNGLYFESQVYADAMLPIGFGFRIFDYNGHSVDGGITVTPFVRTMMHLGPTSVFNLESELETFIDEAIIPVIAGGTFGIGFMYRWDKGLRAGMTFNNIYSLGKVVTNLSDNEPDSYPDYYIPFSMDIGVAYEFKLGRLFDFAVAATWNDFFNLFNQKDYLNNRNAMLDLGIGFQVKIINIFNIRFGMNEMLPAAGIGFDLGPVMIDLSYYGREFGSEPGVLPVAVVDLSIAIRPEAKPTVRPWNRRTLVGRFGGPESI